MGRVVSGFSELGIEYILYKYIHYECRNGEKEQHAAKTMMMSEKLDGTT
jgi:hypothetical protein